MAARSKARKRAVDVRCRQAMAAGADGQPGATRGPSLAANRSSTSACTCASLALLMIRYNVLVGGAAERCAMFQVCLLSGICARAEVHCSDLQLRGTIVPGSPQRPEALPEEIPAGRLAKPTQRRLRERAWIC